MSQVEKFGGREKKQKGVAYSKQKEECVHRIRDRENKEE